MSPNINRRTLLKGSLAATAAGAMAWHSTADNVFAEDGAAKPAAANATTAPANTLPMGQIGKLKVSRMLLGGNLLTHYTHSRDLQYVYKLAAHYNTDEKIMETLALAEQHGINTLSMHNPPHAMSVLKKYRKQGGKIQWIICPTASVERPHGSLHGAGEGTRRRRLRGHLPLGRQCRSVGVATAGLI